ncbi:unnamed protein product [Porites evermanni]|uniref:Glutamine amidotransferase domain-containing protein n=1 Tax=Porites evermanni TaxID=104178 RepID=A0ABN8RF47_9CNID|nr:unnamed protein product [Porites evermanni]
MARRKVKNPNATDLSLIIWEPLPNALLRPSKPRIVGVCFGLQVSASALGGKATSFPSKKFVLQSEKIKANEHFCFQGYKAFGELFDFLSPIGILLKSSVLKL